MRNNFDTYLNEFGTTVTRTRVTETKDNMNRITGTSSSSVTYKADIQWITKKDLLHMNVGDVRIGDGMCFFKHTADVQLHDTITYNSENYRVTSQIEGEQVAGAIVYLGFIIRRDAQ